MNMKHTFRMAFCIACALSVSPCRSQSVTDGDLPQNMARYTSKGFQTYWIGDNAGDRKNNVSLFPGITEETVRELGLSDGAPSSMSAFLIKEDGKNLLFDTGMGTPASLLIPSLAAIGIAPENIDAIFITHLHADHTGGLAKDGKAVFPNATVYINHLEYSEMEGEKILAPYRDRIVRFDFSEELICGIEAIDAAGHTPGHTCYLKGDVLIAGDIMHAVALQSVYPQFCARYDRDPEKSIATRIRILDMAKEKKLLLCGMHFPKGGTIDYR